MGNRNNSINDEVNNSVDERLAKKIIKKEKKTLGQCEGLFTTVRKVCYFYGIVVIRYAGCYAGISLQMVPACPLIDYPLLSLIL